MTHLLSILVLSLLSIRQILYDRTPLVPLVSLIALMLLLAFSLYVYEKRKRFVTQLKSHRKELRAGGTVVVDGVLLRYDTQLTQYLLSVGIFFSTIRFTSAYRQYDSNGHAEKWWCSLVTLVCGWWSFFGPLAVLEAIVHNASGGRRITVGQLIDSEGL